MRRAACIGDEIVVGGEANNDRLPLSDYHCARLKKKSTAGSPGPVLVLQRESRQAIMTGMARNERMLTSCWLPKLFLAASD
jgi:hypothetical protein